MKLDELSDPTRAAAAALLSVCLTLSLSGCKQPAVTAASPPAINVIKIETGSVPVYDEFVGQTDAPENVEIRARVEGYVEKITFTEGSVVKTGQTLYTLDPRPFRAALDGAKADLAKSQADLARARDSVELVKAKADLEAFESELLNAQQNLDRVKPLASQRAVTQAQLDAATAQQKEAKAQVDAGRAAVKQAEVIQRTGIEAAQAGVEAAKANIQAVTLNLNYTTISAPISGRVGRSSVRIGSLVQTNMAEPLTIISTTGDVYVDFTITERQYLNFTEKLKAVESADPNRTGELEMILADGSVYLYRGRVNLTDRTVDPRTGTLGLRATFPNPEGLVKPGQFARIRAVVEQVHDKILVPQQAVLDMLGSRYVYVVNEAGVVSRRDVVPGTAVGRLYVIESGLSPGELVVVDGLQKVRPDLTVKPTIVPLPGANDNVTAEPAPS